MAKRKPRPQQPDTRIDSESPQQQGILDNRLFKPAVLAFLILAALTRFIYVSHIQSYPFYKAPVGDELAYQKDAEAVLAGNIIGDKVFYQDPFYPRFLASVYKIFGNNIAIPKTIQFILGIASCLLIFLITKNIFGYEAAVVSGFLSAAYPLFYFFEAQLLKSSLVVFFALLAFYLLIKSKTSQKPALNVFFAGILTGIAMSAQGHSYFFVPAVVIWLFLFNSNSLQLKFKNCAAFFVAITIVLTPIALRNYYVANDFVLTTYQGGTNFYIGNKPGASGIYEPLKAGRELPPYEEIDAVDLAQKESGRTLKPSEVSSFWFKKGLSFAFSQPVEYIKLLAKKTVILFNAAEIPDVLDYYFVKKISFLFRIPLLSFGFLCPLALVGIILSIKKKDENIKLLHLFTIFIAFSLILFYIFTRYRLGIIPFFIIYASFAIVKFYEFYKTKLFNQFYIWLFVFGAILYACNIDLKLTTPGLGYGLMASMYAEKGEHEKAIEYYELALKDSPQILTLHRGLAQAYLKTGKLEKAMQSYSEALRLIKDSGKNYEPDDVYAIYNDMAVIHRRAREYDKALVILEDLKSRFPNKIESRANLGTVYKKMNQNEKAIAEFNFVLSVDPNNLVAMNNLGNTYRDIGNSRLAMKYYEQCLRLDPNNATVKKNMQQIKQ